MGISCFHHRNSRSLHRAATVALFLGALSLPSLHAAPADSDVPDPAPKADAATPKEVVRPTPSADHSDSTPEDAPNEISKPSEKPIEAAELRKWFNDLLHRDASVREEARVHLMSMGRRNLETFQKIVEEDRPLAPSQASTLRQIVSNVYLSGDTYDSNSTGGWIGIRMQEVVVGSGEPDHVPPGTRPSTGVVIVERFPGFCGGRMLLDGDVILNIIEHPVRSLDSNTFIGIVAREMRAGQTIHFELLRQGQVIRVPLTLDPRPDVADQQTIQELLNKRSEKFEAYWEKSFKPLVEEGVG